MKTKTGAYMDKYTLKRIALLNDANNVHENVKVFADFCKEIEKHDNSFSEIITAVYDTALYGYAISFEILYNELYTLALENNLNTDVISNTLHSNNVYKDAIKDTNPLAFW